VLLVLVEDNNNNNLPTIQRRMKKVLNILKGEKKG
jgi:hypothetical protein